VTDSLQLIARDAEGACATARASSIQVSRSRDTVSTEMWPTVLGLVGRDLLLDASRLVWMGCAGSLRPCGSRRRQRVHLRAGLRELSRVVRDLLVLTGRSLARRHPEIAPRGARPLEGARAAFSREDLLRGVRIC